MNLSVCTILALILFSSEFKEKDDYFEGKIVYKHDIILKNSETDSFALKEIMGNGSTLFFKEGNYLRTYGAGLLTQEMYRKEDNKMYFKKNLNNTSFWIDCGKSGDEIIKFLFTPKKEKVLGIDCDELIIFYKDKIATDYYNSDSIKINPDWFKNYILNGQNQIDQREKSICLKHKTEYEDFIIIQTAISFSREKIDETIFKLAPNEVLIQVE